MKQQRKMAAWSCVLALTVAMIGLHCDHKKVNPVEPNELNKLLIANGVQSTSKTITGRVADLVTTYGIPYATVTVIDTTDDLDIPIATGLSDLTGQYEIPGIPVGTFLVYFSKAGYIDGVAAAFITDAYWSVELQRVLLKPTSPGVVIGAAGGNVIDTDDEGDVIRLDVPAGALDANVSLSVTHLQGLEIPSFPPQGHLSFATAYFGPTGTTFKKSVTITIPLPQQMSSGAELPLYSFDEIRRIKWQDTGIKAVVNADGLTASAQVGHFSMYSVMPEIRVDETPVDTLWEDYQLLPGFSGSTTITYKNQYDKLLPEFIYFPEGAAGVNKSTIVYMFEQLHGVSFTDPISETLYYACPTGTYARSVLKVLVLDERLTLLQPATVVHAQKHIKRPMAVFFPAHHDQGAGQ
jgi:hypothetical protein